MMNDSVREELQTKITQRVPVGPESQPPPQPERRPLPPPPAMITPPPMAKPQTANLRTPKTSPTLVGFQNKNTSIPDWRLQMQNAVQQRKSTNGSLRDADHHFPTNGGAALKAEPRREPEALPEIGDSRVANALRRIEQSREAFFEPAPEAKKPTILRPTPSRPFGVVAPTNGSAAGVAPAKMPTVAKPKLVVPPAAPVIRERRDTNKLPPLEMPFDPVEVENEITASRDEQAIHPSEFGEIKRIRIKAETESIVADEIDTGFDDEIEDLAPLSMRFGAGLFDLIIAAFISMLLLSPIAFSRSDWFTTLGMLVFAGTATIVTFFYMTICLGFFGKTMGMRLFSLELVDAVENEYPSLQQAAVNSSVFIFSLIFAGAGFLTVLFNEERRAAHDLLSGTILVREF
jgi:uncharacterized RDD family membrane protein YckC